MRWRTDFNVYKPIPLTPDLTYAPLSSTCPVETATAFDDLQSFIDGLSSEITYEDWLDNELKDSCGDLNAGISTAAVNTAISEAEINKATIYGDLFYLLGNDDETMDEFMARYDV